MPRASLLLRISVTTTESDSLERQETDLRRLAEQEGLEVVAVHVEDGVSGAATSRPGFRAWLDDAAQGRAEVLLAWRFDRISREGLGAVARILDVLKSSGARLLTYGDRMDSDSGAFRLTAAVLAEIAYAERESIRYRVTSRQASDRQKGHWTKTRPFGYEVVDGRLVQHPTEAPIVRDLAERLMAGASLRALAGYLTEQGVPTPRATKGQRTNAGAAWGVSSVRVVLLSPTVAGFYPHRLPDGTIVPARDNQGDPVVVCDAPILSPGAHSALVRAFEERTMTGPRGQKRPVGGRPPAHPLSGLVRCACGAALVYDARRARGKAVFRCARHTSSAVACPGTFVQADAVEEALAYKVLRFVPALDPDDDVAEAIRTRYLRALDPVDGSARDDAQALVDDARAALEDLEAARYERGEFRDSGGQERFERLHGRLADRLEAAEKALANLPAASRNDGAIFDREVLREALESADPEPRRALYRVLLERVVVARGAGSDDLDARVLPEWSR